MGSTTSLVALSRVGPHAIMDAQLAPPLGMPHGICPDEPWHDDGGATDTIRWSLVDMGIAALAPAITACSRSPCSRPVWGSHAYALPTSESWRSRATTSAVTRRRERMRRGLLVQHGRYGGDADIRVHRTDPEWNMAANNEG